MEKVTPKRLREILRDAPANMARVRCGAQEFDANNFWAALHGGHVRDYLNQLGVSYGEVVVTADIDGEIREYTIAERSAP